MKLLALCIFSLEKCLLRLGILKLDYLSLYCLKSPLYILVISPLSDM